MKRLVTTIAVGLLLVVWLARFVPQTPDSTGYRERTRLAVEQTQSEVSTAALVLERLQRSALTQTYATSALRSAVSSLGSASGSYVELFPPTGYDDLADETDALMSEAQDAVVASRLAVSRRDTARYGELLDELHDLAGRLQHLQDGLEASVRGGGV